MATEPDHRDSERRRADRRLCDGWIGRSRVGVGDIWCGRRVPRFLVTFTPSLVSAATPLVGAR